MGAFRALQTGGILEGMWRSRKFADVTVTTAQEELRCHGSVLAMVSPVFDRMLSPEWMEGRTPTINMQDVACDVASAFLSYIYTGKVCEDSEMEDLDDSQWIALLNLADMYEVPCLAQACAEQLVECLCESNVCEIVGRLHLHSKACPNMPELLKSVRARVQEDKELFSAMCGGLLLSPRPAQKPAAEMGLEDAEKARTEKLQNVVKEGSQRGVEIESTAGMIGLQVFCTSVGLPDGDIDLLVESLNAMNAKSGPAEAGCKGDSATIGKMVFSSGPDQVAIVTYVPAELQKELNCEAWLGKVLASQNGTFKSKGMEISTGFVKAAADTGMLPTSLCKAMLQEAYTFVRSKGLQGLLREEDPERARKVQRTK